MSSVLVWRLVAWFNLVAAIVFVIFGTQPRWLWWMLVLVDTVLFYLTLKKPELFR